MVLEGFRRRNKRRFVNVVEAIEAAKRKVDDVVDPNDEEIYVLDKNKLRAVLDIDTKKLVEQVRAQWPAGGAS